MKKSSSMTITGIIFLTISLINLNNSSFNPVNPFLGAFGFTQLLYGIFDWKNYYNKNIYLSTVIVVSAGILILNYIQGYFAPLPIYKGDMIYFYIFAAILTLTLIGTAYEFTIKIKKYHEIAESYDKVLKINSEDFKAWTNKGNELTTVKEYEKAIESYDKALEINPDYSTALFNKGIVLAKVKKYHEAIETYDKALKTDPNNIKIWNNRGQVLTLLNMYQKAINSFDKALEVDHNYAMAWFNRGIALAELKEYEKALNSYTKSVKLDPEDISSWYHKGMTLQKLERNYEALKSYKHALELDPDFEPAKNKISKMKHLTL